MFAMLSLFTALATRAEAPVSALSLEWDVPVECPTDNTVWRHLAREIPARSQARVDVMATISRDSTGYHLAGTIAFEGILQSIELNHGGSCDALVDKFVLYVAPLFPDAVSAVSLLPAPVPPGAPRVSGGYLGAGAELDVGTLQICRDTACDELFPVAGGSLRAGWRRRHLRVELALPLGTRRSTTAETGDFGTVTTRWYRSGLELRLCGALARRSVELRLCGELGLQILIGAPRSEDPRFDPATPFLPWASARLGLAAVFWLHPRVGLRMDVAPGVHIHPRTYRVADRVSEDSEIRRPIAQVDFVHAVFGVGFEFRLPPRSGARRR